MSLTADQLKIGDLVKYRNDFGYIEEYTGIRFYVEWFVSDSDENLGRSTESDVSIVLLRKEFLDWQRQNII